jgi:sec-independent protein translocase protein TatA
MGSLSIWHWIVVIGVVLLLFGRGKISDLMGDKSEPVKSIDHNAAPQPARTDVGSKAV